MLLPLADRRAGPLVLEGLMLMLCTGLQLCRNRAADLKSALKFLPNMSEVLSEEGTEESPRVPSQHVLCFPSSPNPFVCSSQAEGFEDKSLLLCSPDLSPRQLHVVS